MKYFTFKRTSGNFDDILKDVSMKKWIYTRLFWDEHLMVGLSHEAPESVYGYIVLKYGDDVVNPLEKDFTPLPGKDYSPKKPASYRPARK